MSARRSGRPCLGGSLPIGFPELILWVHLSQHACLLNLEILPFCAQVIELYSSIWLSYLLLMASNFDDYIKWEWKRNSFVSADVAFCTLAWLFLIDVLAQCMESTCFLSMCVVNLKIFIVSWFIGLAYLTKKCRFCAIYCLPVVIWISFCRIITEAKQSGWDFFLIYDFLNYPIILFSMKFYHVYKNIC